MGVLIVIGNVLLAYCAVVGTASVVAHLRVPWRATQIGRHLMAYMGVIALVFVLGVVRLVIGDSLPFAILRTIVFVGVPIVMTQRLVLQIRAQRDDRRTRREDAS